jgi:hypothetical protein
VENKASGWLLVESLAERELALKLLSSSFSIKSLFAMASGGINNAAISTAFSRFSRSTL